MTENNKSISKIRRISDGKEFGCYFRNGVVLARPQPVNKSYWIEIGLMPTDEKEELVLAGVSERKFKVLEYIEID